MTKEKQIDEMAKTLRSNGKYCEGSNCETCYNDTCFEKKLSEIIYTVGYRKASDVAREIFEEIEKLFFDKFMLGEISLFEDKYAELKKKYTEGEG